MSVDVVFDFRIMNAGSRAAELGARLEQIIAKEGFRDDLTKLAIYEGVVYLQSKFPTIISSSYSYLPKLRERLVELERDGAVVVMLTSIDGSEFAEEVLSPAVSKPEPAVTTPNANAKTTKTKPKAKAKAKPKTKPKAKAKSKAKSKTKPKTKPKTKTKTKGTKKSPRQAKAKQRRR